MNQTFSILSCFLNHQILVSKSIDPRHVNDRESSPLRLIIPHFDYATPSLSSSIPCLVPSKSLNQKLEVLFRGTMGFSSFDKKSPFCLSQNNFETVSFDDSHIRPETLHLTQLCLPLDFSNSAFSIFLFYPLILLDSLSYPNALSSVLERVLDTLQSSLGVEKWRCPSDINNSFFNILKLKALNFHGVSQLFGDWLASPEGQSLEKSVWPYYLDF